MCVNGVPSHVKDLRKRHYGRDGTAASNQQGVASYRPVEGRYTDSGEPVLTAGRPADLVARPPSKEGDAVPEPVEQAGNTVRLCELRSSYYYVGYK